MKIDYEIISMVIVPLLLIQERQLSVTLENMHIIYWLTHLRLNKLSHTIYWNSPFLISGVSCSIIWKFLKKYG